MKPRPKVGAASLLALHHPWLVAVGSGVAMFGWCALAVRLTVFQAAWAGVVVLAIQIALWVPESGPARKYTERLRTSEALAKEHLNN